jgi:RimJ/RimL family protein N-acetyltransferase
MSSIKEKDVILKNGMVFTIRTAVPSDAYRIIRVMKRVLSEKIFAIHEVDEYKETITSMSKKIRKYRRSPGKIILTALLKNTIVAYVTFNNWDTRKTMHTGFLSIYLAKEYRGIGLGKELMRTLLQWGRKNKLIQKMSLAVFSCNKNAIALYKKVGFKIEGLCPRDIKINGRYYDSVFMYKFVS